jgi:hypothetical protein
MEELYVPTNRRRPCAQNSSQQRRSGCIDTALWGTRHKRLNLHGFVGGGAAWTGLEKPEMTRTAVAGGAGFRYELARDYGIHVGLDVAFGPDEPAVYVQVGSAWARR